MIRHTETGRKISAVLLLLAIIGGCIHAVSGCGGDVRHDISKTTAPPEQHATAAQKLAVLDADSHTSLDINDPRVQELQRHLTGVASEFGETEESIANATYIATQQLARKGLTYSNVQLLTLADKNEPVYKQSGMKYAEFISAVVALTSK